MRDARNPVTAAAKFSGFGAPAAFGSHVFKLALPPGRAGSVVLTEGYGFLAAQDGTPDSEVRAELPRSVWTPIADASRRDFNFRLRAKRVPASSWKPGDNLLDRMLGKELCVLIWAAERATEAQVDVICSKWTALRPEERWWLYSMTAAEAGNSDEKDRGWRKALYYALSDGDVDPELRAKPTRPRDHGTYSLFG